MTSQGMYVFSDWQAMYQGIDHASGVSGYAFGLDPLTVRIQHVNALRVDLRAPGISFFTNPQEGTANTQRQPITKFLAKYTNVRVAINANFAHHADSQELDCTLFGLAISQGELVCDPTQPPRLPKGQKPTDQKLLNVPDENYVGAAALLITKNNMASIQEVTAKTPVLPLDVYTRIRDSFTC